MKNLLQKSLDALISKQTNIFSAAFFIILTTVFSQLLGLFKYRLLVSLFGASNDLGVFFAAFRIPDFIFQVVIAGALSTSFIPVFSEYVSRGKQQETNGFTSSLINIGIIFYITVTVVVIVFARPLVGMVAPGFTPRELDLMAQFMILIQLAQLFLILGTVATAVLQSLRHFLIPGLATAFYNVGIIVGLLVAVPFFGIYGAAVGVMLGALLFFLVQIPILSRSGFKYLPTLDLGNGVLKIVNLMVPRSMTLVVTQVAITANVFFASFISARSLVIFDLAQTLVLAPVVLFGQSIAQAAFPTLVLKKENKHEFLSIFLSSYNQILYLTLPISVLFIVLRIPIVRLFFGASRFDWPATVDTGRTLAYFSVSIAAQSLIYLFARGFYAHKDTRTPFVITVATVTVNIFMGWLFVLVWHLPIYFLAGAFSIANILAIVIMYIFLNHKIQLPTREIILSTTKITIASLITGVCLYIPIKLLDQLVFDTTHTVNLIILTGIASLAGLFAYTFFSWILRIREAYFIIEVMKKFRSRRQILEQIEELIDGQKLNP